MTGHNRIRMFRALSEAAGLGTLFLVMLEPADDMVDVALRNVTFTSVAVVLSRATMDVELARAVLGRGRDVEERTVAAVEFADGATGVERAVVLGRGVEERTVATVEFVDDTREVERVVRGRAVLLKPGVEDVVVAGVVGVGAAEARTVTFVDVAGVDVAGVVVPDDGDAVALKGTEVEDGTGVVGGFGVGVDTIARVIDVLVDIGLVDAVTVDGPAERVVSDGMESEDVEMYDVLRAVAVVDDKVVAAGVERSDVPAIDVVATGVEGCGVLATDVVAVVSVEESGEAVGVSSGGVEANEVRRTVEELSPDPSVAPELSGVEAKEVAVAVDESAVTLPGEPVGKGVRPSSPSSR